MNASEKLRKLRIEKGYSQEYMAAKLGLSQSAYSKIERGKTKLTIERLESLTEALEASVDEVLQKKMELKIKDAQIPQALESEVAFLRSLLDKFLSGG